VGIGTTNPATKFHTVGGIVRFENTVVELKTGTKTSNILSDTPGNIFINPSGDRTTINSDVTVAGDFSVGGAIDLGDQVAIGLGGATANTALHVNGGIITNSDAVASKRYTHTFTLGLNTAKDIRLFFDAKPFYAKVIAQVRSTTGMSTIVLELQGGYLDQTIAIGTKNIFGGTVPWDISTNVGKQGLIIVPAGTGSQAVYTYDISVEVVSSSQGKLKNIRHNVGTNLENETGGSGTFLKTFDY
jgi:hypothetical protein